MTRFTMVILVNPVRGTLNKKEQRYVAGKMLHPKQATTKNTLPANVNAINSHGEKIHLINIRQYVCVFSLSSLSHIISLFL